MSLCTFISHAFTGSIFICLFQPISSFVVTQLGNETIMEVSPQGKMIQEISIDEISLLQTHLNRHVVSTQRGFASAFDCELDPKRCGEPFHCDKPPGITTSGGAHPQAWCASFPFYEDYLHECLANKDLINAGRMLHDHVKQGIYGHNMVEQHGSYCFIEGHCLNTRVTPSTTMDEGSAMCDERFGREHWSGTMPTWQKHLSHSSRSTERNGYNNTEIPDIMAHAACDAGMYHCDVIYCKETYCKDEEMVKKYSHFLDDLGWRNSTASWMHP